MAVKSEIKELEKMLGKTEVAAPTLQSSDEEGSEDAAADNGDDSSVNDGDDGSSEEEA